MEGAKRDVGGEKITFERIVVPTVMYVSESWGMRVEKNKLDVVEMNCLRNMCEVTRNEVGGGMR